MDPILAKHIRQRVTDQVRDLRNAERLSRGEAVRRAVCTRGVDYGASGGIADLPDRFRMQG